jgi:hypothetical protein
MLIFGGKLPIRYPFHEKWVSLRLNLRWILYESSFFLFNIEGYGEFFSGITQKTFILKLQHDTLVYFVTFWCGKCQTGSVVTVQSQFERGKIAKVKNFNNFMLRHLVDFKYGIWWYHFWNFSNPTYFSS